MSTRTVKEGNAFYEIDEECMRKREEEKNLREDEASRIWAIRRQSDARHKDEISQSIGCQAQG